MISVKVEVKLPWQLVQAGKVEVPPDSTVEDLLRHSGIDPGEFEHLLLVLNHKAVDLDDKVRDGDHFQVLPLLIGG